MLIESGESYNESFWFYQISYETRKKISASLKGKNTWAAGVPTGPMSPSVKKKISLKNKGSGNGMAKVVIFIKDGIIKGQWGSAAEAVEFNKMKDYTMRRYIKKYRLYNGGYFEFE